jgi:hypothetical protein
MPGAISSTAAATGSKNRASRCGSCSKVMSSGHIDSAMRLRIARRIPSARATAEVDTISLPSTTATGTC